MERLQNQFDRKMASCSAEIDRLEEERQGLKNSMRRMEDSANVTCVQPARSAASTNNMPLPALSNDIAERWRSYSV